MSAADAAATAAFAVGPEIPAKALKRLVEISARLLAEPDLDSLLPAIVDTASSVIAADAYALWRAVTPAEWRMLASLGLSRGYERHMAAPGLPMPDAPIIMDNIENAPALLEQRRQVYRAEGIAALLIIPLRFSGQPAGTLAFYFHRPRRFAEADIKLAQMFAELAAGAIGAAERHEEQARQKRRSDFLSEASTLLNSSLDYETTLTSVARLAAPYIADGCIIDVLENDGQLHRVATAHPDGSKLAEALEIGRRYAGSIDGDHLLARLVRTGEPYFRATVTDRDLVESARDEAHLQALRKIGMRSSLVVPLIARERVLGALTLATTAESGRTLDERDLALARDLAARAAVAIDNAQLHRALQHSQQRLELAQHAAGAWSWEIDLGSGKVTRSRPPTTTESSPIFTAGGQTFEAVLGQIHPDDRERVLALLKQGGGSDREHDLEYRVQLPDGSTRWLFVRGRALREAGKPARLVGIAMDVTARKQVEEELRATQQERERSMALLSAFVTSAPVGFALHDPAGRILDINPYLASLHRVPREEHFGRPVHDVTPVIAAKVSAAIEQVMRAGEPVHTEIEGDSLDPQRPRWWMSSYFPVKDAQSRIMAVGSAVIDVTEHKLAENAARERQRKLEVLTQASRRIHAELQIPSIMRVLVSSAVALVEAQQGAWALHNIKSKPGVPGATTVVMGERLRFSELLAHDQWTGLNVPFESRAAGAATAETLKPFISNAPDPTRRLPVEDGAIRSYVNVPIVSRKGKLLGCIELYNKSGERTFDFTDVELLEGLAASAAVAIENGALYEEAQADRARLHAVLAHLPVGIIIVEAPTGKIVITNTMAQHLYGRALPIGGGVESYRPVPALHPDGRPFLPEEFPSARCMRGDIVTNEELETERSPGERVIFRVSAAPVRLPSGQIVAGVIAFDDVTSERRAERELALVNERLRRAQQAGKIVSWEVELRSGAITWSASTSELYGPDLPATVDQLVGAVHPDDRGRFEVARQRMLASGWATEDFRVVAADGLVRWVSVRGQLYSNESGEPERLVGTSMDVTERKTAEDVMRKTEKLAAMGRLAATVAHEINNPLEAVTNLLYLLRREAALSAQGMQFLSTAEQELSRVTHIVKQTLGFYRDTSAPVDTSMAELLDEVLGLYSSRLHTKNIAVHRDYAGPDAVRALRGEIRQVLSNLVANCIDAIEHGGAIYLSVIATSLNDAEAVTVIVRDTGVGIPREKMSSLFEPFFTTKKESGTGLGLWVSRGLVEKHGGTISVESSTAPESHGTAFTITLPRQPHLP